MTGSLLRTSRALALGGGLALATGACAGPERVPHVPIPGVSTEENEVDNPHDPGSRSTRSSPPGAATPGAAGQAAGALETTLALDDFIAQIAAAHAAEPGIIAVFPALSPARTSPGYRVTALGELLMWETATRLEGEGVVGVVAGHDLINDLQATNRSLAAWQGPDDVYWIADRIGASYAVFGTAVVRELARLDRDRTLEIRWRAKRTRDRRTVATCNVELDRGEGAQQLYRYYRVPGSWQIGAAAPPSEPSLQLEARILARDLARTLAAGHGDLLRGSRVRVEPTVVTGRSGAHADLQTFAIELNRELRATQRELAANLQAADVEHAALAAGPVTIQGTEYPTLGDAADAYLRQRAQLTTTLMGDLEHDVAAALAEHLREAMRGDIHLMASGAERDRISSLLRREARAARMDASIDPFALTRLRAQGTDVMIHSTLRPALETYLLRVTLLDLSSGEKISHSVPFEPRFTPLLTAALSRPGHDDSEAQR